MSIDTSKAPVTLPQSAKSLYVSAFNSAYQGDEADAASAAWLAIKGRYNKSDDGKWLEKSFSETGLQAEGLPLPGSLIESPFGAALTWIAAFQEEYDSTRDLAEASNFAWARLKSAYVQGESGLWTVKPVTFEEALAQAQAVAKSAGCWECGELAVALRINLPEATKEALCEKFGDFEGFRTRCMEQMEGEVEDAGAFCNSLKIACHGSTETEERSALVGRPFGGFEDWEDCIAKVTDKGNDEESAKAICGKIKADTEKSILTRDFDWDACISEQRESGKSFEEANDACEAKKGQGGDEAEPELESESFEIRRIPSVGAIRGGGAIILDGLTPEQEDVLLIRGHGAEQAVCPEGMSHYEWIARGPGMRTVDRVISDKRRNRAYHKKAKYLVENYGAVVRMNPSNNGELIFSLPARVDGQNETRRYSGVLTHKADLTGFEPDHWEFRPLTLGDFRGSLATIRIPADEMRFRGPVLK